MEIKKFKRGEVIFKKGAYEDYMYDVRWGSVGIFDNYGEKDQRLLKELTEGDFFGEMGLIEARPRSATAVALTSDVQCGVIDRDNMADYFKERPAMIMAIMQYMSHRIRELSDQVAKLSK